jgi:chemotaxis protein MotA
VLGIVITMGHLDGGPEEIGRHVAAALVGTFLGILLCYGFVGPMATRFENQGNAELRYLSCIKSGLLAASRGSSPQLAIEFARRAIFPDERPSSPEIDQVIAAAKA